jgi:uncharacterized protein YbjT (DUF2867 family)
MKIAVAGGTGCVGRLVVAAVRGAGETPVVLARAVGVDLTTGAGLDDAMRDVSTVIDVSNVDTFSRKKSIAFFETATQNLLAAGMRAGVSHHVALSIVGVDRFDFGYYAGKNRQEELVLSGRLPASVLRATQFHEFAAQILERMRGPFVAVPASANQPIAAREVADALVTLALGERAGLAPELAGPERQLMVDMVRRLARARGSHRIVVPVRLPGSVGRAMLNGGLLPASPGPRGVQTFDKWLAAETAAGS